MRYNVFRTFNTVLSFKNINCRYKMSINWMTVTFPTWDSALCLVMCTHPKERTSLPNRLFIHRNCKATANLNSSCVRCTACFLTATYVYKWKNYLRFNNCSVSGPMGMCLHIHTMFIDLF